MLRLGETQHVRRWDLAQLHNSPPRREMEAEIWVRDLETRHRKYCRKRYQREHGQID
jgi:hypothetical protein